MKHGMCAGYSCHLLAVHLRKDSNQDGITNACNHCCYSLQNTVQFHCFLASVNMHISNSDPI
jgi:hypothetical protein